MSNSRNVLITGGAGFLGSHIAQEMAGHGMFPVLLDVDDANVEELRQENVPFIFFKGSVDNRDLLCYLLRMYRPTDVLHLAGISHTVATALGQVNALTPGVIGLATIYDVLKELEDVIAPGSVRVLIASSSLTSGIWRHEDPRETFTLVPNDASLLDVRSCYHQYVDNKLFMEMLCHSNRYQHGVPFTIFRFGTQYGPRMKRNVVTWYFIRNALLGMPMMIHGDGSQVRQHFYCKDLADAVVRILLHRKEFPDRTVSVVCKQMTSVLEIAKAVQEAVPGSKYEFADARSIDVKVKPIAQSVKLAEAGWKPLFSLNDGIEATVRYYKHRTHLVREGFDDRIKEEN